MMHAMHVRRDDENPQNLVEPVWHGEIGVVEHGATIEDDFEQKHGEGRRADREHHYDLPQHREPDLDRVKADRRGHVDIAVGVVNLV